jgi:hypothetical protein
LNNQVRWSQVDDDGRNQPGNDGWDQPGNDRPNKRRWDHTDGDERTQRDKDEWRKSWERNFHDPSSSPDVPTAAGDTTDQIKPTVGSVHSDDDDIFATPRKSMSPVRDTSVEGNP